MKKLFYLLLCISLSPSLSFAQTYILNEDFSGTSGTTPPAGWSVEVLTGTVYDQWHFDNPGQRILNYPVTEPFAIFDGELTSSNGQPEQVALQTPSFDASISNYILLYFDHLLEPSGSGTGKIEAYDGDNWIQIISFNQPTNNPEAKVVDLSQVIGGVTNAGLRFVWSGNGAGYWGLDNIRIYASLPLDGGIVALESPVTPVEPGVRDVIVTLGNFGYNTISSTTIEWTANGTTQPSFNWNGSLVVGETQPGINIGSFNFQGAVLLKIWQTSPNNQADLNPYNDTITRLVQPALCGTYTIGGVNPDFESFAEAAQALNNAGVSCAVTFLVRDGYYEDQFILTNIQGASAENNIVFESESGNSELAVLQIIPEAAKYESLILLNESDYITFRNLGIFTGSQVSFANDGIRMRNSGNITVEGCNFSVQRQFDNGIILETGCENIIIHQNNYVTTNAKASGIVLSGESIQQVQISENVITGSSATGYPNIIIENGPEYVTLSANTLGNSFTAIRIANSGNIIIDRNLLSDVGNGISIDQNSENVSISSNRIINVSSNPFYPDETGGIFSKNSSQISIANNFIHTKGDGSCLGIFLDNTSQCNVLFNSLNIDNDEDQNNSRCLKLARSSGIFARNNIFNITTTGIPISIEQGNSMLDFDFNNYRSKNLSIGIYEGNSYYSLPSWATATGMDNNSLSSDPFFTSPTDLSINQALLNGSGVPVAGIETDIDGQPRDPQNPDIGAKEYTPCAYDAGINEITSPRNPLPGGLEPVVVALQNQWEGDLLSATIHWEVNGELQSPFEWTGNLPIKGNTEITIGQYTFVPGKIYVVKAWSADPNGNADCNNQNDTAYSQKLAAPLCGNYTIGGNDPDFITLADAVSILNISGISCAVTFLLREGEYEEKLVIEGIQGSSAANTVTFRSENGSNSSTRLKIDPGAGRYESLILLRGSGYISFLDLRIETGSNASNETQGISMDGASNILIDGCFFNTKRELDFGIRAAGSSSDILISNNTFESNNPRAGSIFIEGDGTKHIDISGNHIKGATDWLYNTLIIEGLASQVTITGNTFERCFRSVYALNSSYIQISNNQISGVNNGIFISDWCEAVSISGNRILNVGGHPSAGDGTDGVLINNASSVDVVNNFIHSSGDAAVTGITINRSDLVRVLFNSINITTEEAQGKSNAVRVLQANNLSFLNNICRISEKGTPIRIEGDPGGLDFDRNDYYSFDRTLGRYNGIRYTDLEEWRDDLNLDLNSFSVNPFFSSGTDLSINQVLLNNSGIPQSGVITDIDGTPRNAANPDIGAKEYDLCPEDAGINEVTNPDNPLTGGLEEVRVTLQNQGSSLLNSVKINWIVNDQAQETFNWTGSLSSGQSDEVTIGDFEFLQGKLYTIRVWTSDPNGTFDCNNYNDTVYSREMSSPLCGTYTVGGDYPDFETLTEAVDVLTGSGVTCPVTFLIRDGTYTGRFLFREIPGISGANTVVFQSENGDSSKVIIRLLPEALKYDPLIFLEGTSHLTFRGIGFITGSSTGDANPAVEMKNAANIRFEGCYFNLMNRFDFGILAEEATVGLSISGSYFDCSHPRSGAIDISGPGTRNISVEGNRIMGAEGWGSNLVRINDYVINLEIAGNSIERSLRPVYITRADTISITGNTIKNANEGLYFGGWCSAIEIAGNRFISITGPQGVPDGTSGIYISNSSDVTLVNNFIHGTGAGPVQAVNLENLSSVKTCFNTINITNTDPQGKSRAINLKNIQDFTGKNNIFHISSDGIPFYFDENVTGVVLDYNNYYHPGNIIGVIDGIEFNDIFDWGQTINGDANSMTVNTYFQADTVPLPFQKALNGAGITISGILYDIDGKLRNAQAPDMGCLEFLVDYGITELVSPTLNCFHESEDSVTIYITHFGDVPFDELKVAFSVNGGTIHYDTIPGPLYGDIVHTFGPTVNITESGEYSFRIWLIGTLDDNINNDTLNAIRYSKPPPDVSFTYDNFCTGPTVYFYGQASIGSPYVIDHFEWLFGDGDASEEQNPVHTFASPGTYEVRCRAYSDAGCYSEDIQTVFIDPEFKVLDLEFIIVPETCLGDGAGTLEIITTGNYPPFTHYLNGERISGTLVTNLTMGEYEIRVVDSENCELTETIEVMPVVYMNPRILAEPVAGNAPLTVDFDFTVNHAESWTWYFEEGATASTKQATHTFDSFGDHEVVLEVNSGPPHNCTETDTVVIFVDVVVTIEANTVFTPNGDGYNDFFEVKSEGLADLTVDIFSQWGNKLYEMRGLDSKWDGNTKGGSKAPDGTYLYTLAGTGINNKVYQRQGSILLLRNAAKASPVPARDKVKVDVYDVLESPVNITVYNIFGQVVRSESRESPGEIIINVSNFKGGVYIVKISDGYRDYFVRIVKS